MEKIWSLMEEHGIYIDGVIHVGANTGGEAKHYYEAGARAGIFVEPIKGIFDTLSKNVSGYRNFFAVNAVCSDRRGETVKFNISGGHGEASSMFDLGKHLASIVSYTSSEVMQTITLDDIVEGFKDFSFNALVVDVQGADLKVLKGGIDTLENIDAAYVEVSHERLYLGGCTFREIDQFMEERGFLLNWLNIGREGFGDAFYVKPVPPPPSGLKNLALGRPATMSSLYAPEYPAERGNNGEISGWPGFCTKLEDQPWWQADLGEVMNIREVRVFNRVRWGDEVIRRARNFIVLFSCDGVVWNQVYDHRGRIFGGLTGRPAIIKLSGQSARFVRLQLKDRQYFHIDEVQVF